MGKDMGVFASLSLSDCVLTSFFTLVVFSPGLYIQMASLIYLQYGVASIQFGDIHAKRTLRMQTRLI